MFEEFLKQYESLLAKVWNDKPRFDSVIHSLTTKYLSKGFTSAITIAENLNSPDHLRLSLQEANITRYSAAKTVKQLFDLNKLANKSSDFSSFYKEAQELNITYNKSWLNAEYKTANAAGQTSADYYRNVRQKELFPYVQFDTTGDGRVRDEHAKLDGMIVKVGSKEHDFINPPLGFGCRCRMRQVLESEVESIKDLSTASDIENALKSSKIGKQTAYDIVTKHGFDKNVAKTNEVFTPKQFFVKNFKESGLKYSDFDKQSYETIKNQFPRYVNKTQQPVLWFEDRVGFNQLSDVNKIRLKDYRNRPITWAKKRLNNEPETVNDVLQNPSEVWLIKNKDNWSRNYIKFYNDKAYRVNVILNNEVEEIRLGKFEDKIDSYRKGILL